MFAACGLYFLAVLGLHVDLQRQGSRLRNDNLPKKRTGSSAGILFVVLMAFGIPSLDNGLGNTAF